MAGPSSAACDDRRGRLHHRLPVRGRRLGDKDLSGLEVPDVAKIADNVDPAGGDALSHRLAPEEHSALFVESIGFEEVRLVLLALDRLRTGLNKEYLPGDTVLGPLHVHGPVNSRLLGVVLLDLDGIVGKQQDLVVRQAEGLGLRLGDPLVGDRHLGISRSVDHAELFFCPGSCG